MWLVLLVRGQVATALRYFFARWRIGQILDAGGDALLAYLNDIFIFLLYR
jgi:hypothetical protein